MKGPSHPFLPARPVVNDLPTLPLAQRLSNESPELGIHLLNQCLYLGASS